MIQVRCTGEGDPLEFEVIVREGKGETRHDVTMSRETCERLTAGRKVIVGARPRRTGARPCGRRTCRGLKHSSRARGRKGDSDVPLRVPRAATQSVICSNPGHRPRVSR